MTTAAQLKRELKAIGLDLPTGNDLGTPLLIRHMAKELAGTFYSEAEGQSMVFGSELMDRRRSKAFRDTYPTWEHYKFGIQVGIDRLTGKQAYKIDRPAWHYFVGLARKLLVKKLGDPAYPEHKKEVIYEALMQDNKNRNKPVAQELLQRRFDGQRLN